MASKELPNLEHPIKLEQWSPHRKEKIPQPQREFELKVKLPGLNQTKGVVLDQKRIEGEIFLKSEIICYQW